ncbi:hypothetical protein [Tropicibacter sp. Alg240-R139]|nr:hypothetical protein [Tropicibacter sp. Alg240-R139]
MQKDMFWEMISLERNHDGRRLMAFGLGYTLSIMDIQKSQLAIQIDTIR